MDTTYIVVNNENFNTLIFEAIFQFAAWWYSAVEWNNYVECPSCDNACQIPADQQRHHMSNFEHLDNYDDGTALYKCISCGAESKSKILSNFD